ncbi:hypothetical protein K4F52_003877 [Lecanicillium sp. MT-2017a]|nr:hypothetical protein K4F52_003877 [Lecanicillium sp. MT-2017a]
MSVDLWRRRASSISRDAAPTPTPEQLDTTAESKKPRVLSKALRSLSNSSVDSLSTTGPSRSSASMRRLQKTSSGSNSMIERLHRRVSKESANYSPVDCPPSPLDASYASMDIVRHGPLKPDSSARKARTEHLVLTDTCLAKFISAEAARVTFPQIVQEQTPPIGRSSSSASISSKLSVTDVRLEIPLVSLVAVFAEASTASPYVIELWWSSPAPRLGYCRTELAFATADERDEWLRLIHRTGRSKMRSSPTRGGVPDNVRTRIQHIIRSTEPLASEDDAVNAPIYPVMRRQAPNGVKAAATDDGHKLVDLSSFYFVIGPFMCYFIEVLKADTSTAPGELRAKVLSFGTVSLTRFQASVATHQHTFGMVFRVPFGRDTRLTLASVHYRRIIEHIIKTDRILKPTWPQHLQQAIFDIRGLSPPLQLTSGNDLGGLDICLPAYCAAFQVAVPNWTIEWNTPCQPSFRLLPADAQGYSALQMLAVCRALRYNSFFKALSFRDVDLTPLAGKYDLARHDDCIVYASANRLRLADDHYEMLSQATTLEQEIHSLVFASDSIRSIDLSNTLGLYDPVTQQRRILTDVAGIEKMSSEMIRPIVELLRRQLSHCHSIYLTGNMLSEEDVEDFGEIIMQTHVHLRRLEIADCGLGDSSLSMLWKGLACQGGFLEVLDTSNNYGTVKFDIVCNALSQFKSLTKLCMARNTRLTSELSLFDDDALSSWPLQELDLSGITLNDATVESLAKYLATDQSQNLRVIRLNGCGLTASHVASLFRSMGQRRELELHINSNRLDEGMNELCEALGSDNGPWSLFMQMIDFYREESYVKLLRALALNNTIECLSLAGSSTPDAASETACQAVFDFLAKNTSVRYLDMSGYESKLDEGRLGRGFSRALGGLRHNKHIEHLRVRSQMLNINIGELADAVAENSTLQTLDCELNDFNLSNFWHLIKHLESNTSIRYLSAFSENELDRSIQTCVNNAAVPAPQPKKPSMMSRFKHEKTSKAQPDDSLAQELKGEWATAVRNMEDILAKNQANFLEVGCQDDSSVQQSLASSHLDRDASLCFAFGGLALHDYDMRRLASSRNSDGVSPSVSLHARTDSTRSSVGIERSGSVNSSEAAATVSSDAGSLDYSAPTPPNQDGAEPGVGNDAGQWTVYGDGPEDNYTYTDGIDSDGGLQMKRYRRFCADPTDRIEEEE